MLNSPALRAPAAALLALPVAYGLFLMMQSLIDVEEIALVKPAPFVLTKITPHRPDPDKPITDRIRPHKLDAAVKPPPPPQISVTRTKIDVPMPHIPGAAPDALLPTHVMMPPISPVVVGSRDFQVIRPPLPIYPRRAAERGLSGTCRIAFDIDPRGKPYNVSANCSDPVFTSEAERSVSRAEFAPKLVDGQFVTATGLEYPMKFSLPD